MKEVLEANIVGEISPSYLSNVEQYDADSFTEQIQKVFDSGVTAIVWSQYTPYFNDGDPCVFNVNGEGVFSTKSGLSQRDFDNAPTYEIDEIEDDADAVVWQDTNTYKYVRDPAGQYGYSRIELEDTPQKAAVREFMSKVRHYYVVLQRNFGDHAKVVATPDAFYVEYYEHD